MVFTIRKHLRLHTRFERKLLGKLCSCAWTCITAEVQRVLGRDDVLPGMIGHPHGHAKPIINAFDEQLVFLTFEIELDCSHFLTEERMQRIYNSDEAWIAGII